MLVLVTTLLPSHSSLLENIIETSKWLAGIEYSRLDQGHLSKYAKENMVEETHAAIHAKAFDIDAKDQVGRGHTRLSLASLPHPSLALYSIAI